MKLDRRERVKGDLGRDNEVLGIKIGEPVMK